MNIKFGNQAVETMVTFLNRAAEAYSVKNGNVTVVKESELAGFAGRVYLYERPKGVSGEYIVVNHLPFKHVREVEEGIVNVNVHVPRLHSNVPDSERLSLLASHIVELFDPRGTCLNEACFQFYADSRPIEENDGTYFINLQFKVTFNNLDYRQIWQTRVNKEELTV